MKSKSGNSYFVYEEANFVTFLTCRLHSPVAWKALIAIPSDVSIHVFCTKIVFPAAKLFLSYQYLSYA